VRPQREARRLEADDLERPRKLRIEHRPIEIQAIVAERDVLQGNLEPALALVQVVEDRPRPAQGHGGLGWRVHHGEPIRDPPQRDRQLDDSFGVTFGLRDRVPEEHGQDDRDEPPARILSDPRAEVAWVRHAAEEAIPPDLRATRPFRVRRGPARAEDGELHSTSSRCSVVRRVAASTSRVIVPSRTSEIVASSSETTITMASVSSVSPIAARWRVPRVFETLGFVVSGRKQPAAVIRPCWTMRAPSWIGESGRKMLVTSSRETRASSRVPTSMYSFRPTSFWRTTSAPTRRPARCATARTISSTACPCAIRSRGENSGPVPTCVRS